MKKKIYVKMNEFLDTESTRKSYYEISEELLDEIMIISSSSDIKKSKSYSKLISIGGPIVPFIMESIKNNKTNISHFMLLSDIIGDVGMPENIRGNSKLMSKFYLNWFNGNG